MARHGRDRYGRVELRYFNEEAGTAVTGSDKDDSTIIHALHFRGGAGQPESFDNTQFKWEGDSSPVDEWHTYQLWWSPNEIRLGVDGNIENAHYSYIKPAGAENDAWPFDHPMDIILNLAMGGSLGSANDTGGLSPRATSPERCTSTTSASTRATGPYPRADSYVAAAEGVVSLMSDTYPSEDGTAWNPWGEVSYQGLYPEDGHAYAGVHYFGIETATPLDLSGTDTIHLTLYRTDPAADLTITLVDYGADGEWELNNNFEGEVTLAAGTAAPAAGRFVELVIPKILFCGPHVRQQRRPDKDNKHQRRCGVWGDDLYQGAVHERLKH